ncbi:MAG: PQQ-dependent sugar dehydrogenase [Stackebrandtia sp.]
MTVGAGPRIRRICSLAGVALAIAALASCTAGPDSKPAPSGGEDAKPTRLGEAEVIATGLEAPWSIAFHDDTPLISERDSARVLELDTGGKAREVGTIAGVASGGEGGLLGIAVHEDHLYVYSTGDDGNRIERYKLAGEPGALRLGKPDSLLERIPAAGNHNGGRLAFGPDGMLYATTGDAGDGETAQDRKSMAGKILRMTPEGGAPEDNPFDESLVYSYGHRNPQGIAWAEDGTMYASEFGQDTWDELNVIKPGDNYGWPDVEGIVDRDGFVDPVQQWEPAEASPSGMTIANDTAFITALRGERLLEVPLVEPASSAEHFTEEFGRLRDAAIAPDGSMWLLTNNTDGRGDPDSDDDRLLSVPLAE